MCVMAALGLQSGEFLVMYALVCAATLLVLNWITQRYDENPELPALTPSGEADPRCLALLSAGADGLIALLEFDLLRRGFLCNAPGLPGQPDRIERAAGGPGCELLTPIERLVVEAVAARACAQAELRARVSAMPGFIAFVEQQEQELVATGLLRDRRRSAAWSPYSPLAAGAILGVGALRWAGTTKAHFVETALVLLVALGSLAVLHRLGRLSRRTARGNRYLRDMRAAFAGLVGRCDGFGGRAADPHLAFCYALFGPEGQGVSWTGDAADSRSAVSRS